MKRHVWYPPTLRGNALQMAKIQSDPKTAVPKTSNKVQTESIYFRSALKFDMFWTGYHMRK